jgi:hypothetical protein
MANITVSRNYLDGVAVTELHSGLNAKRNDVLGILQGRLQIDNGVHTSSKVFMTDSFEYGTAEPSLNGLIFENNGSSTNISSSRMLAANINVGDLIVCGSISYQSGAIPGLTSGFTSINAAAFSPYHGWRFSYKLATSSDILGGVTVSNGSHGNMLGVFKIAGSGTITKGTDVVTSYSSDVTGNITPPTTYPGGIIVIAVDLAGPDRSLAEFTDDAGTRRKLIDLDGLWEEDGGTTDTSMIAYRSVDPGTTVAAQSADVNSASFNAQIIMHFYKQ